MPPEKISFTELTHIVLRQAPGPLTIEEIIAAVSAIAPITTKNPKQTIRNAISASPLILSVGKGHYDWKCRLIDGSHLRHTLQEAELAAQMLFWDNDLRDALWPGFFAPQKYDDRSPATAALPDGAKTPLTLEHRRFTTWGTEAGPALWDWLLPLDPAPGDALLFEIIDAQAKRCRILFERRAGRDEAAVAERNRALLDFVQGNKRLRYARSAWELPPYLFAAGFYRHPVPPDPISELWPDDLPTNDPTLEVEPDPLAGALFGQAAYAYDIGNPPDLPPEYDPEQHYRRPRRSRQARRGSVTSCVLRIQHRALPEVWRDIELAEDNTLEDLHLEIQSAFGWSDDHLYSFFMSGRKWDRASEIGSPWSDCSAHTHQVQIGSLGLTPGRRFLYLFDYGDNHEFDVTVLAVDPLAPKGDYPRTLEYHGYAPAQYPEEDEDWDPYAHWGD